MHNKNGRTEERATERDEQRRAIKGERDKRSSSPSRPRIPDDVSQREGGRAAVLPLPPY